jgi:hypothetical protein
MSARVVLSEKDKEDYLIMMVKLFKEFGAEKVPGYTYDYKVKDHLFKIDSTTVGFYIYYKKEGAKGEETIRCNNEDNVYSRTRTVLEGLR